VGLLSDLVCSHTQAFYPLVFWFILLNLSGMVSTALVMQLRSIKDSLLLAAEITRCGAIFGVVAAPALPLLLVVKLGHLPIDTRFNLFLIVPGW